MSRFKLYVMPNDVVSALSSPKGTTIGIHSQVYSTTSPGGSIVVTAQSFTGANFMPNIAVNVEMMQLALIVASRDGETEWRSSAAGRELQLQPGAMMPDVEGKLTLDNVQSREKGVKEDHSAKCAKGVALGTHTGGNSGIVGDRVHTCKRWVHILAHPVGKSQTVGGQSALL
jgi:hypothetical protein